MNGSKLNEGRVASTQLERLEGGRYEGDSERHGLQVKLTYGRTCDR